MSKFNKYNQNKENISKGENNMSYNNQKQQNKENLGATIMQTINVITKNFYKEPEFAHATTNSQTNTQYSTSDTNTTLTTTTQSNNQYAYVSHKQQPTQKYNFNKNSTLSNHKTNFSNKDDELFQLIGQVLVEEENYLKDKTLIPNTQNYDKYLFVKKKLNEIARNNNSTLREEHNTLHAHLILNLYVLDIREMKILFQISKFCSAMGIDADLNGQLTLCVTVPDVYRVFEEKTDKKSKHQNSNR